MNKKITIILFGLVTILTTTQMVSAAKFHSEGVGDYALIFPDGHANIYGDWDAYNFSQRMGGISGWVIAGEEWENNDVWDTDFMDTDRPVTDTQLPGITGQDNIWFDAPGENFSFASMHGTCQPYDYTKTCLTASDCASKCLSSEGTCVCSRIPLSYNDPTHYPGFCVPSKKAFLFTSSTNDTPAHGTYYRYNIKQIALGENSQSGGWGGAGTNGGTAAAYFVNSCAAEPYWWQNDLRPIFAGLIELGVIMPVAGYADPIAYNGRGDMLGYLVQQNQNQAIYTVWHNQLTNTPNGCGCQGTSTGGYGGICGCGANLSVVYSNTGANAQSWMNLLSWNTVKTTLHQTAGNAATYALIRCNYDCNTYPMYH